MVLNRSTWLVVRCRGIVVLGMVWLCQQQVWLW